ncbi:MAG: hypothetical protein M0Z49_08765 [Chloroflexi bacterium]|nr:hypothetical protein [Chloroflexota bacterium]
MSDLRAELLYTLDCPHWERVRADLHAVLAQGAIETQIQLVLIGSQDDAEFLDFPGSPTVRLNGVDVVPPPPGTPPTTGCRLYPQPDGTLSGRIPVEVLAEAVRMHRQGRLEMFQREESAKVAAAAIEAAHDEAQPGVDERRSAEDERLPDGDERWRRGEAGAEATEGGRT